VVIEGQRVPDSRGRLRQIYNAAVTCLPLTLGCNITDYRSMAVEAAKIIGEVIARGHE
jgi:hypothetical protein